MNIHYLQHVPFEELGSIHKWILHHAHRITVTRLYENDRLPTQDQFDWLCVLGGPMNIYEEARYPWLVEEKRFIEQTIASGKTVLGICLGAQLLAGVLGAQVYANPHKEIGWFPVEFTEDARHSPIFREVPQTLEVFHWHGDTFDLPADVIHLARNDVCANQAFLAHERILGLQFHIEITPQNVWQLITHCQAELVDAPFIQTAEEMLTEEMRFQRANEMLWHILDRLAVRDQANNMQ